MSTTNPLNYTNYDFDDLKTELINRLKITDAWRDTYESSTGTMIIEFFAYVGNMLLYYLERRAEECYIATAMNKSSVINLVKLINYTPKRSVSSQGSLTFTLVAAATKIVYFPKYTTCQTADGTLYVIDKDVSIIPPSSSVIATAIQGKKLDLSFSSDGSVSQEFAISDTAVENTNYFVLINGATWTEVSTFISSVATSEHYRLVHELDDTLTLIFGDGIRGKIPTNGLTITFRYVQSDGLSGNVYQTDKITTLNDIIYDEDGAPQDDITVTNSTTFTAGDDAEDIEEIRTEAPQVFSTGDRAVTRKDFKYILNNYPSVADSNAWGENEESPPNYDLFNTAKLCVILENWQHPTDSFKDTLGDYLYDLSMLTVKYDFIQAEVLNVVPLVVLKVNAAYSLSAVQALVETAITNRFVLGTTTKLGTSQKYSNIIRYCDEITGVGYLHLVLEIRQNLVVNYEGGYDYGGVLAPRTIREGSVKVYAQTGGGADHLMATDDGAGNFTDTSSSYTVSGYITYSSGAIGINFDPDAGITGVYVRYQQDVGGDIDISQNQICKLYEIDIASIGYVES